MKKVYLIGAVIGAALAATTAVAEDPGIGVGFYDNPEVIMLSLDDGPALDYGAVLTIPYNELTVISESVDADAILAALDFADSVLAAPDFSPLEVGATNILSAAVIFSSALDGPEFDYGSSLLI